MAGLHPAKVAALIERLDDERRDALWQQVDPALEGRILPHLRAEPRQHFRALDVEDQAEDAAEVIEAGTSARGGNKTQRPFAGGA